MAEVKWIKIVTGIFEDEKIKLIETLPECDSVLIIWVKLLCLAGKANQGGAILLSDTIAYTDEMLATIFARPVESIRRALQIFEVYGMIEQAENVWQIVNWERHQNIEGMDKIKAQNRVRKQRQRAKLKHDSFVTSRDCHGAEEEKREDEKVEKKRTKRVSTRTSHEAKGAVGAQYYMDTYNEICVKLSKCKVMSAKRELAITRFETEFTKAQFAEICHKANASAFLTGQNERAWRADFDFLLRGDKVASIIEGKYDDKENGFGHEMGTSL